MDILIHNIEKLRRLVTALEQHTKHKTMRVPCEKHGQALYRVFKPPPIQRPTLCGLLNENLMAVDFTKYRRTDRHFLFQRSHSGCCIGYNFFGCRIADRSAWECYVAKYP